MATVALTLFRDFLLLLTAVGLLVKPFECLDDFAKDFCSPSHEPTCDVNRFNHVLEQGVIQEPSKPCVHNDFGHGSTVCTCNATYCDIIDAVGEADPGHYWVYTSSKDDNRRLEKQMRPFARQKPLDTVVWTLHRNQTLQTILGFGGSFTDSAGININSLSLGARRNLLRSYFSDDGIEYTLGRVPIGGADFSTRGYTYLDGHDNDFSLTHFELADEDLTVKIPVIREAQQMSARPVRLMASPWSPPVWMKTNGRLRGKGKLKGEPGGQYYKTYARYLIRFLDEYAKRNVSFWGLTAQNEPLFGNLEPFIQKINNVLFNATDLREFIVRDLGPMLAAAGYSDLQLMAYDDLPILLPFFLKDLLLTGSDIHKYVSGLAFHYYFNRLINIEFLTTIHQQFPNFFLLSTEACEGVLDDEKVKLGSWNRAESYAQDIIEDLLHWTGGWIDWNLALDKAGGPNWCDNAVDSPIIVDAEKDVFYKQPMFYVLAHFSKFLPPDSRVVNLEPNCQCASDLYGVAAVTPANTIVAIILNLSDVPRNVAIQESTAISRIIGSVIPSRSIQTYVWTGAE